jgi:hypothetical protein
MSDIPEEPDPAWESDDSVRRTVVLPAGLSERLAARAERRGLSVSDLLAEYADEGLRRDEAGPGDAGPGEAGPGDAGSGGRG